MKAFHTVAIPHEDILSGKLTMDVFAADLWLVSQNKGPAEYSDPQTFFQKTYLTQGLQNLLGITEKRLLGRGGDPVVQIQTPFGGGKTHSLIALYHEASHWGATPLVIAGTALGAETTLWGWMEHLLTGDVQKMKGDTAPGKDAISELLVPHQPLLILMDEVLEYTTKAAGRKVEDSNLAAQTSAFLQELSETVSILEETCLIITLPSSIIERYDESAERLYQQLQKIAGRLERIYTPIEDHEITSVIKSRLFSSIDEGEMKETISTFVDFAQKENLLPVGMGASEYGERFLASYPFLPEVIDALYHRWGSFTTFQRTRGVLRLLALVVYSLKDTQKPYISLADFDLGHMEIRQELLKHIGSEYNSIIASDITDSQSGSKRVNESLGNAYQDLRLGSRTATSIFLMSFSGGQERGASLGEIKRCSTTVENPPSVIAEAVEHLKSQLFYLQSRPNKLYFTNQPNLNRIIYNRMENIDSETLLQRERMLLKENITGGAFQTYLWETDPVNIQDNEGLKLIVLRTFDRQIMEAIVQNKGQTPRVNRNSVLFLCPLESERSGFKTMLKRVMAFESINEDADLNLTDEQKKEVNNTLRQLSSEIHEAIRGLYRTMYVPARADLKQIDMGIPTYGISGKIDQLMYQKLRTEGEILEVLAPLVIKERYLAGNRYVKTEQLYRSALTTPGEPRPLHRQVIERGISEGVRMGLFGLGNLEEDEPMCRFFKEDIGTLSFTGSEILIRDPQIKIEEEKAKIVVQLRDYPSAEEKKPPVEQEHIGGEAKEHVYLGFKLPKGKVSSLLGIMNYLQSRFDVLDVKLDAHMGSISKQEYEEKILEGFRQMGVELQD